MTRLDNAEGLRREQGARQQGTTIRAITAGLVVILFSCLQAQDYVNRFAVSRPNAPMNPRAQAAGLIGNDCASSTVSPTGHNPMHWTPCRQDMIDRMEADYAAVSEILL